MMIWEKSKDPYVQLCVEFRKAVVNEISKDPVLNKKIMGAFTKDELREFSKWSAKALTESLAIRAKGALTGGLTDKALNRLDEIVLDMSEKSAEMALRVLGRDELQAFVDTKDRTTATEQEFKSRNYPHLARIFSP